MVWSIDRKTRDTPWNPVVYLEVAVLFGTRAAEPILAGGHVSPPTTGRTYDRKRSGCCPLKNLLQAGAVHIWIPGSRASLAPRNDVVEFLRTGGWPPQSAIMAATHSNPSA